MRTYSKQLTVLGVAFAFGVGTPAIGGAPAEPLTACSGEPQTLFQSEPLKACSGAAVQIVVGDPLVACTGPISMFPAEPLTGCTGPITIEVRPEGWFIQ